MKCNCVNEICAGSFRLSYDGEISAQINIKEGTDSVVAKLRMFKTVTSSEISISYVQNTTVCTNFHNSNLTFYLQSLVGSLPRISVYGSVLYNSSQQMVFNNIPNNDRYSEAKYLNSVYYNTDVNNTHRKKILTLLVDDGRADSTTDRVKLCNGVGKCNEQSGTCECHYGYGPHEILGPCGALKVNSSKWGGISRCPGVVNRYMDVGGADIENIGINDQRLYLSFNPSSKDKILHNTNVSYIASFVYDPSIPTPKLFDSSKVVYMLLTSNSSAGPMVIDHSTSHMFFIDANPDNYFIAKSPLYDLSNVSAQLSSQWIWLQLSEPVSGFAMDATIKSRKLYWSSAGKSLRKDGHIMYANMDDPSPTSVSLVAAIGQSNLLDPMGIAVDYVNRKLLWLDRKVNSVSNFSQICLRSSDLDGTNVKTLLTYDFVNDQNQTSMVDLVVDVYHNNTAYFVNSDVSYLIYFHIYLQMSCVTKSAVLIVM